MYMDEIKGKRDARVVEDDESVAFRENIIASFFRKELSQVCESLGMSIGGFDEL
jgi:hypothetical protein